MNGWLKWLARRRYRQDAARLRDGFDYAAGLLLRGVPADRVEKEADEAVEPDAFDRGIRAAVAEFKPRPHIVSAHAMGEMVECDCGREHPAGWVCASAYRDQM